MHLGLCHCHEPTVRAYPIPLQQKDISRIVNKVFLSPVVITLRLPDLLGFVWINRTSLHQDLTTLTGQEVRLNPDARLLRRDKKQITPDQVSTYMVYHGSVGFCKPIPEERTGHRTTPMNESSPSLIVYIHLSLSQLPPKTYQSDCKCPNLGT